MRVRDIWADEARDFTPWLFENADRLADSLGIDLELEQSEFPVGTFSLDLLGRDLTHECPLIIENQLEDTDHRHLGQLLTYAAGTDAMTVVWIAPRFRDEHRQALEYLNDLAGDDARFFGVEIQVAVIGDSDPAPIFNVAVQPSDWRAQLRSKSSVTTASNEAYREFWSTYLTEIHANQPGLTRATAPQPQGWMNLNTYRNGITFMGTFLRGQKLSAEVYIDPKPAERNSSVFEALLLKKNEIESELGATLDWQPMPDRQACRIRLERDGSIADRDSWTELREWLTSQQVAFKRVFEPLIKGLDDSVWNPTIGTAARGGDGSD